MLTSLAKSRIRFNKSRTILTAIAITLTTMLLMALGTSAIGLLDSNKQVSAANSNVHATFSDLTSKQVDELSNHADIESLETNEIFGVVDYDKMNGFLSNTREIKGGITYGVGELIKGREAKAPNEICGPKAFFERMNVEPEIGNEIEISYRVQGEGRIKTEKFVISGLVSERDISDVNISDSRIAYSAAVSEKLVADTLSDDDRVYNANLRVKGEADLDYDQITEKINDVAVDIGCDENNVRLNKEFLVTATDPGTETMGIVAAIALLIIVFSGMVIYSIYYVGVITDVQEIGKLKALGASKKQIKRLLLREGMFVSAISIPIGIILGFLIPYFVMPVVIRKGLENSFMAMGAPEHIHMFSIPVIIGVILVVLVTVYISLFKPMRMAGKISPMEAIRYQENTKGKKTRFGNVSINLFRLSKANLMRNKRRTIVTMVTMALSCVLFMSVAGVLNSMDQKDIANRTMEGSDFKIEMDYALTDKQYPENNLENINKNNPFTPELIEQIKGIDGVESVRRVNEIPISCNDDIPLFEEIERVTISELTREMAKEYSKELKRGDLDYDKLVEKGGILYTADVFWEDYGLTLEKEINFTLYDGSREIPFTGSIEASVDAGGAATFLVPEETYESFGLKNDSTTSVFIDVDEDKYEEVKSQLGDIVSEIERFSLYSMDEEQSIGAMSVNMIKYPMYGILLLIAVIGFMNLINTMITSIVTRKKELGMLQAIGLSNRQLTKMLAGEGMVFTIGTLIASMTLGNIFGYLIFLWAKSTGFMSVSQYHYPVWESLMLIVVLMLGQLVVTFFIGKRMRRESLVDRIRLGD